MFTVKETSQDVIASGTFATVEEAQHNADSFNYWAANGTWTGELNYIVVAV